MHFEDKIKSHIKKNQRQIIRILVDNFGQVIKGTTIRNQRYKKTKKPSRVVCLAIIRLPKL